MLLVCYLEASRSSQKGTELSWTWL